MDGKENVDLVFIIGTGVMLLLAIFVIAFIIFYQRKIFNKQNVINEMTIKNQRKLIQAEIQVKEREQKRIAQELHDDIGASLNGMRFMIDQIDDSQQIKSTLTETVNITSNKVRQISNDLLPHVLEEFGLSDALFRYIGDLEKAKTPLNIKYVTDKIQLSAEEKDIELSLYRIVQELLTNIIKYAEATEVKIETRLTEDKILVTVADNGNGILPVKNQKPDGLGLRNIESRIQYIKGTIRRELNQPKGTVVTIEKTLA